MISTEDPILKGILDRARGAPPEARITVDRIGVFALLAAGASSGLGQRYDPRTGLFWYNLSINDGEGITLNFVYSGTDRLLPDKQMKELEKMVNELLESLTAEEYRQVKELHRKHEDRAVAEFFHARHPRTSIGEFIVYIEQLWDNAQIELFAVDGPD